MKLVLIFLFCVAMLFPWVKHLEHTYQSSLWTSSNRTRGQETNDWQFRIGGETSSTQWTRLRLGFPARYATIDVQRSSDIVQVRIEPSDLFSNLIPVVIGGLILVGVRRLWRGPKTLSKLEPTKT